MSSAVRSTSCAAPRFAFSFARASSKRCPSDVLDDLPVHQDQPAVRVVREALVPGSLGEPADGLVVQAEVEDRVHHPGHRDRRPGADGDEQRILRVAEPLAGLLLERGEMLLDLGLEAVGKPAAVRHVGAAGIGRDRETRRHRHSELGHLGEPDPLAAEQLAAALGGLVERVDVSDGGHAPKSSHSATGLGLSRPAVGEPGERAEPEPDRRQQHVEDEERGAHDREPRGPAPQRDRRFRLHEARRALRPGAARRGG